MHSVYFTCRERKSGEACKIIVDKCAYQIVEYLSRKKYDFSTGHQKGLLTADLCKLDLPAYDK
jgi:hypothetical protein